MNVIIVGGGQVGSYLASLLLKGKHNVKIIEMREKQLSDLKRDLPAGVVIEGNFTSPEVLEKAGIDQANVVVAVTPTDEGNLVVATLARFEFGVKRVIARANNPKNSWLFTPEMGVDVGLTEADLMAHVVADELSINDMQTLLKFNKGQYSLVQGKISQTSPMADKMLRDIHLPDECLLVSITRKNEVIIPHGDTVLLTGDEIQALTHISHVHLLAALAGPSNSG